MNNTICGVCNECFDPDIKKVLTQTQLCYLCRAPIICWKCALVRSIYANIESHNKEEHQFVDIV